MNKLQTYQLPAMNTDTQFGIARGVARNSTRGMAYLSL